MVAGCSAHIQQALDMRGTPAGGRADKGRHHLVLAQLVSDGARRLPSCLPSFPLPPPNPPHATSISTAALHEIKRHRTIKGVRAPEGGKAASARQGMQRMHCCMEHGYRMRSAFLDFHPLHYWSRIVIAAGLSAPSIHACISFMRVDTTRLR